MERAKAQSTGKENEMDLKKYIPVIAILSVLFMVAWGTLAGSYKHSWLAVFAGGCLIAVISVSDLYFPRSSRPALA